jgi:hypothetical protein
MEKSRRNSLPIVKNFLCVALFGILWGGICEATTYSGRATIGGYYSREHFSIESDGQYNNDFETFSSRLYTRFSDIGDDNVDLVFDLRDKHDFFEKLDAERLALKGNNTLQLRQLSLYRGAPASAWRGTLGRFPITDAGAVDLQGADAGLRWAEGFSSSVFGGWDTKLPDQTWVQFNPHAYAFGTYTVFQPPSNSWKRTFHAATAFVGKEVSKHLDRLYLYDFFLWEWNSPSRIMGMMYLDFRPRTYVQTGFLSYTQQISKSWQSFLQGSAIDAIEYSRRAGILQTLPSSPYKEATASLREEMNDNLALDYAGIYGYRTVDGRRLEEYSLGAHFNRIASKLVSGSVKLGGRKNFTSRDYFTKLSLGYYPKDFELNLDESFALQKENGTTYYPLISELSLAYFFSREVYGTVSYENAFSKIAKINSFFLYVGYRFGSKDVAPLRDGAPPRGRL